MIERERLPEEMDGLRYYADGTVAPLWEEWFHCTDLGTQLGPVVKRYPHPPPPPTSSHLVQCSEWSFLRVCVCVCVCDRYFASEEHKTGKPPEGKVAMALIYLDHCSPSLLPVQVKCLLLLSKWTLRPQHTLPSASDR